jgi:hypothetical protein
MSATPEEVEKFLRSGSALASKIASGVAGTAIGTLILGPPGALIGAALAPVLEHHLTTLAGEFVTRQLGNRQQVRAGAGALLLTSAIHRHLEAGDSLRSDEFQNPDDTGRRPMDELAEQAVVAMVNSVEERRLPYLANFYASLYFDDSVARTSIATLVSIADSLNFRAMCILNILGRGEIYTGKERTEGEAVPWPVTDHVIAKEVFGLVGASVVVSKSDDKDYHSAVLGYLEIEPGILRLGAIGRLMFEKMGLAEMPTDLPELLETKESLVRIAMSAAEDGPNFERIYKEASSSSTFERSFAEHDWTSAGDEFVIVVEANEHGRGTAPMISISTGNEQDGYQEAMTDLRTSPNGRVELAANRPFSGRVLIQ